MNLTIKSIDKNNYEEIKDLRVSDKQVNFIESVEDCLKESVENPEWKCVGIYDDDKAVGFAMYGFISSENRVWFDRFLISYKYQGMGYGEAGVRILLKYIFKLYGCEKIYLSVYNDNKAAIYLYNKVGFEFNGELYINGEDVMEIDFKK